MKHGVRHEWQCTGLEESDATDLLAFLGKHVEHAPIGSPEILAQLCTACSNAELPSPLHLTVIHFLLKHLPQHPRADDTPSGRATNAAKGVQSLPQATAVAARNLQDGEVLSSLPPSSKADEADLKAQSQSEISILFAFFTKSSQVGVCLFNCPQRASFPIFLTSACNR